ncbi:MAG: hypothetical protein K2P14_03765 [Anaeroplasmataceae bacterium]|nr:hypothetical protein [Anaeroplasmataceae bacterium]
MSYSVEWIPIIDDRTYGDVQILELDSTNENTKGSYNYFDLNRIENNTQYCKEYMIDHKIIKVPPSMAIKTNWTENDIPTRDDMIRIVRNVMILMNNSNPIIQENFTELHEATQFTYQVANAIEHNLNLMHNQPDLPIQKWLLKVEHGIIQEYNDSIAFLAEDEIVHIQGIPYGEDAIYMQFTNWSGNTDDLQYVEDVNAQVTTFQMVYHDYENYEVELTANFKTRFPRTLTLYGGTIYDDIGGTSRQFFAGNEIRILANDAASGKRFYEWQGTEEGIDNLTGGSEPSTSWLTMPDCDVELTSFYINAGQHAVYVDTDEYNRPKLQGWYDYKEHVYLDYGSKSNKWRFTYWSGDTQYLENVTSSSLIMPDINLYFTSNWEYVYSYNTVSVTNGTIQDNEGNYVATASNLREQSSHLLQYNPPPAGKGFQKWQVDGVGSASASSFTVGDGNATLTALYGNLHSCKIINNITGAIREFTYTTGVRYEITYTGMSGYNFKGFTSNDVTITRDSWYDKYYITMPDKDVIINENYALKQYCQITYINLNNTGNTTTSTVETGYGHRWHTNMFVGDYVFDHWEINGTNVGTNEYYPSGTYDRHYVSVDTTVKAIYRQKVNRTLTVVNGTISNTGNTTGTYLEGTTVSIIADDSSINFNGWSVSGAYSVSGYNSKTASVVIGRGTDVTATATYANYYKLTVNNGSGSGTYKQGTTVQCRYNTPVKGYEFANWTENDRIISYSNPISVTVSGDRTITANYTPIPEFDLTVINGRGSGTYLRGTSPQIIMNPAPDGMQFLQWEVITGDDNDVLQPRAENTTIRSLTHDTTVQATYYIPNPEIKYTLTITGKDGEITTYNYPIGEQVNIWADFPDEGYEFYKWVGDTQYVNDKYAEKAIVNMPGKNISLGMEYRREGFTTTYHVLLEGGKIQIEEDRWDIEGEFEEGTTLNIKADDPMLGWEFFQWKKAESASDEDRSEETVSNLTEPETTIQVQDFDITLAVKWKEKDKYVMEVEDGFGSGSYYEGQPVQIYFDLQNTETSHYKFIKWSGKDVAYLNLMSGKIFDIYKAEEQAVKMPSRNIKIKAEYDVSYLLSIQGVEQGYYLAGEKIQISAEEIEDKVFQYWTGDVDCIDSPYNPNIVITMPKGPVNLIPVYSNTNERNSIGYILTDLYDSDTIRLEDIVIISGEIDTGFIITDGNGHIYVITTVYGTTADILRLTTKDTGPEEVIENGK